jgi:hypothetical protein
VAAVFFCGSVLASMVFANFANLEPEYLQHAMCSQILGIHSDMLSLYNNEMEARSEVDIIEKGDESGAMDRMTGLIRRRSVEKPPQLESKSESYTNPFFCDNTAKAEVARLKRVIKRTERNRLKLKAVVETIEHSCLLVKRTDTLYPIELFGLRADWKQVSAVGALLASVIAALWRASA